jgi:xanthine/uracil/vitamin C permease (AzgA family)
MSDQRAGETPDQGTGAKEAQAANLFDLRRIIGGLFVLYGVVLTIVGLGDSDAEIEKAAGVHINLWAGLGMLALGSLFIAWALLRPLGRQLQEEERKRSSGGDA